MKKQIEAWWCPQCGLVNRKACDWEVEVTE
jgi:hypothetical protein